MSWREFPDLRVESKNGLFLLEARSPDNGPSPDPESFGSKYGHEQSGFCYRLLERSGKVLWERFQVGGEFSPVELYLSEDGWSVIRTHGRAFARLIAVSPAGVETGQILVTGPEPGDADAGYPVVVSPNARETSARLRWAESSVAVFFNQGGVEHFSLRGSWGGRIVLCLESGSLVPDCDFESTIQGLENAWAEELLSGPYPTDDISPFLAAVALVLRNGNDKLVPLLERCWLRGDFRVGRGVSGHAVEGYEGLVRLEPRPVLKLVLLMMRGDVPGYSCYEFSNYPDIFAVPERLERRSELLDQIHRAMNSAEVLRLVGSPDYIESFIAPSEEGGSIWGEIWDYYRDNLGVTRITWEAGCEGKRMGPLEWTELTPVEVEARLSNLLR